MQLTNFQKMIIRSIADNNINNNATMAKILFEDREIKFSGNHVSIYPNVDDLPNIRKKLINYHVVCKILKKESLIQIIKPVGDEACKYFSVELPNPDPPSIYTSDSISKEIVKEFRSSIIIPSYELEKFIEDGFKTKDEVHERGLVKRQTISIWISIILAVASIIMSIITFFRTSYREVVITNPGAFSNEMKVIIEKEKPIKKQGNKQ